jgi:hypothetical protein
MTREVLKLALETLEIIDNWLPTIGQRGLRDYEADTITAIKAALAQPEQPADKDAEIARLTACLKAANASAEKFERERYLRGDEIEAMQAQPEQEPAAYMYPADLKKFETNECFAKAFSISVSSPDFGATVPLYASPPKRQPDDFDSWYASPYAKVLMKSIEEDYSPKRQPLTDEEINDIERDGEFWDDHSPLDFVRAIEAAHGIGDKT